MWYVTVQRPETSAAALRFMCCNLLPPPPPPPDRTFRPVRQIRVVHGKNAVAGRTRRHTTTTGAVRGAEQSLEDTIYCCI